MHLKIKISPGKHTYNVSILKYKAVAARYLRRFNFHTSNLLMKIIFRICLFGLLTSLSQNTSAANRYWVGNLFSNWNNIQNWSSSSGGLSGLSVPGAGDAVFFDAGSTINCSIDANVSVASLNVGPGYTGTISQGSFTIAVGGATVFASGTFTGGTANITITGAFTLSGGAFSSTSTILELRDNAAFTGGTFTHNGGTVRFNCTNNPAEAITGTGPTFYQLEFTGISRTYTLSGLSSDITVVNSLNLTGTQFLNLAGGVIDVQGNITSSNSATGCGGDAQININGSGTQTFTGSTTAGAGAIPKLTINKTAGTLNLANYPAVANNFQYTAGTVSPGTSTFCFTHGTVVAYGITGSLSFANLEFIANTSTTTLTLGISTTLTATGNVTLAGAGSLLLNAGNINANGNLVLTNTGTGGGGSTVLSLTGTGGQTIDGTVVTANQSRLPVINFNSTGTIALAGNISFAANVSWLSGTITPGTSAVYIVNTLTLTGSFPLYNVTISAAGNTTVTIASGSTVTANHTLDLENGSNYITLNTGTIAVLGDLIDNNSSTIGGGTATILLSGAASQNITSTGVIDQGKLPAVTIANTGGTITLPSVITVVGNWTYTSGTLDVTTNSSTVVFENTLSITGTHTLNNVIFNGNNNYTFTTGAATILTLSGSMSLIGTGNVTFNGGNFNLNGNLILTNSGSDGGTTILSFVSAANQTVSSTLPINQSTLPSVTINKPGGTLTLPAMLTVKGSWTYAGGTLDVTTNNSTVVFACPLSTGLYGFTGSHTLNNVVFEGNNNSTATANTGTVLTVAGSLSFTGASNIIINTTVAGATAIQAQGDITISNTSLTGGGTGVILINGPGNQLMSSTAAARQGLLPGITIQKTTGTLTLSGILSESRNWTYTSGTVDAVTNASTVVFGGNSLTVTSAGMSFYHTSFVANTMTLANSLTATGNLTVSGTSILAPGGNTVNVAGNWTNWGTGGFTESTSTVNLNGTGLQIITVPGGESFASLTINNSGTGVQFANPATVSNTLTMTQGNIDLNGNTLTLGLSAAIPGSLNYSNGTLINTGFITRWYSASAIIGNIGLFPTGTASNYRPLTVTSSSNPTTGGTITVSYNDASTNSAVSFADGASTVQVRKDLNWAVSSASGFAGGVYNLAVAGSGFGMVGSISDLRLTLANGVTGTAGTNAGTTGNPQVTRTGVTPANLSNSFFIGSVNPVATSLPVTLISFTGTPEGKTVLLSWTTATETNNDYFVLQRSKNASTWITFGQVPGAGTTTMARNYTSVDSSPDGGITYYQLIQTDLDGHETYSNVIAVNTTSGATSLTVYPNPASSVVYVSSARADILQVTLFNSAGRRMSIPIEINGNNSRLTLIGLSPAMYFIRIDYPGYSETKEIIVRKP
jgi:Secretion system C-terminal sorting domain